MMKNVLKTDPLTLVHGETGLDETAAVTGDFSPVVELSSADVFISLVRNVSDHHVIEEDTERPDCSRFMIILTLLDPLWRRVDSSPVKVCEDIIFGEGSGSKVYEAESASVEINDNVLILDVSVSDSVFMTLHHCLNNVSEQLSTQIFTQEGFISDEIKEIFATTGSLKNIDEGVSFLDEIVESDNSLD